MYRTRNSVIWGRTIDMSHIEGVDDGIGYGVRGSSTDGLGVSGHSDSDTGVYGNSPRGAGVFGESSEGFGVYGNSPSGSGVYGESHGITGVSGYSPLGTGVSGISLEGIGLHGSSKTYAAYLDGRVFIRGPLVKPGGTLKIDHPLDPENKYLYHSFVESPDMKNIYDGIVVIDSNGEAKIDFPDWFGALNKEFRYQLTAVGAPGPNLHIAEEISDTATDSSNSSSNPTINNSRFRIAGGTSGMKVSWQVTGIRRDPWANANRIQVEEKKPDKEQGYYIYPDLYGKPEENGLNHLLSNRWEVTRENH